MAACSEVKQFLDTEESKDQTFENVLSILSWTFVVLTILSIILVIRHRKIIIKKLKTMCCRCYVVLALCVRCCKRVKGEDHQENAYLIHSWEQPEVKAVAKEDYKEEEEPEESLVLSNPNFFEFTLHVDDDEIDENEADQTIFNATSTEKEPISPVEDNPDIAETSFTDDNWQQLELEAAATTKLSFVDILVAPKEKQQEMIYGCENHAITKLEAGFRQNYTSFVLLLVEVLGTKLVAAEKASRKWKVELLDICKDLASYGHNSRDISDFMTQLVDKINTSLKKTDISVKQSVQLVAGFEDDLGKFEMVFSIMYLKEVEKLQGRTNLKEILIEKLTRNMQELLEEMTIKYKSHISLLQKIQMESSVHSFPIQTQAKLASDIKTMWQLTIKKFKSALNEQKLILKAEINHRMDRDSPEHKVQGNSQEKIEMLVNRDLKMAEFIDSWCSELRNVLNAEAKQDYIEVNFTTTEFNALMEMLGVRHLQQGIKAEKELLSQLTAPGTEELISRLETDHSNQKASIRSIRHNQESELRAIVNATALTPPLIESYYFNDLKTNKNFIQGMLEIQVDLSEVEQRSLREKFTARLSSCEVQFELEKLKHERRLRNDIRTKTMLKESGVSTSSSNTKVGVGLSREEKATHSKAVEDTRSKLVSSLHSTEGNLELLFHQQIEKIRGTHEMNVNLVGKQERALNVLKSKLLERISNSSEQDTGERLLNEYHINLKVLDQEIERSRVHQEQVLQQKIQSRKLEKIGEERNLKQTTRTSPFRVGSAKRFAANCLISLLMDIRHKHSLKKMDDYNAMEGEKLKLKLERRYYINTKLSLQLHEREMIIKLASALNMSREDLEKELKDSISVAEISDKEMSKSVLNLFDTQY